MIMTLHMEGHVDILMFLLVCCPATSLCRLAQTCRLFRSLVLENREEAATQRLETFHAKNEGLGQLLREFGGLCVWNNVLVLASYFHIDKAVMVAAQFSVVDAMMKNSSLSLDESLESIVYVEMQKEGATLLESFVDRGLFPFDSKLKELYYFEKTESSFFDKIVSLQCILMVFLKDFTTSDLVAWLRSKVRRPPLCSRSASLAPDILAMAEFQQ